MKKLIAVLLLAALLAVPVLATEIDTERTGSITATMEHEGTPVPGGTLTLYKVASLNFICEYTLTEEYAASGISLEEITAETAVALATYTYEQNLSGLTKTIGDDGVVKFEDLEVGLYLLIQWDNAPGYYELSPFVISIPNNENGEQVFDTFCAPKQNPDPTPTEPTEPTQPTEPPTVPPTEPTQPTEPTLPQTGQTNWPIPILAVCGIFLVVAGTVLVARGGKRYEDA